MKRWIAMILTFAMTIPLLTFYPVIVNAEETTTMDAYLTDLKDDKKALITMTFDDGDYDTVKWVTEKFEKYGLYGSSMLIVENCIGSDKYPNATALAKYKAEYDKGRLEPISHSMTHIVMPSDSYLAKDDFKRYYVNNTAATYEYEIVKAKEYLEKVFPNVDQLAMAPSNNTLSGHSYATDASGKAIESQVIEDGGALKVVQDNYYACRQGQRGYQSLDPTFETTDTAGSWYSLKIRGFKDEKTAENRLSTAKGWVDDVIENHQWLITMSHQIPKSDELTKDQADAFYAYVAEKVQSGELWCTTFTEATKYIRERQSSTVSAVLTGSAVSVTVTMADKTADGKELPADVFNAALTVCVEVPAGWRAVSYNIAGRGERSAQTFTKNGKTYVYIDCVPNGGTVTLNQKNVRTATAEPTVAICVVKGGASSSETLTVSKRTAEKSQNGIAKTFVSFAAVKDTLKASLTFTVSDSGAAVDVYGMMTGLSASPTYDSAPGTNDYEGFSSGAFHGVPLSCVKADGKTHTIDVTDYVLEKGTPVFALTSADGTAVISDLTLTVDYATYDFGHKVTIGEDIRSGLFDFTFPLTASIYLDRNGVVYKAGETVTLTKNISATPIAVETLPGAALRLKGNTAIRFDAAVSEEVEDALSLLPAEKVVYGMIIAKAEELPALQRILTGKNPITILEEDGVYEMKRNNDGTYSAVREITDCEENDAFTAVAFILVRAEGTTYASFCETERADFTRSAAQVAEMAIADVKAEKDDIYRFATESGNYSRYDETQIGRLKALLGE